MPRVPDPLPALHTHTLHTHYTHTHTHTWALNKGWWVVATARGGWRSNPQECHQPVDLVELKRSQRTVSVQPAGRQAVRA